MSAVLELEGVSKHFGGIIVADNINLNIDRGQIVGLIGPNGAGKTSLFNIISGIVVPDAGAIRLNGQDIHARPIHARARAGVARTWQNMRLFRSMTVLENLLIAPREYHGESLRRVLFSPAHVRASGRQDTARAQGILQRMGLAQLADHLVVDIPYGQQKLIGFARALMNDGDLLLLDEPMAGVEGQAFATMQTIVREEAKRGRAVCVVEHNISFIEDLCSSAVFMSVGKILEQGSIEQLLASPTLAELYFGA
jgi:branched-chain amino acid transport system ATP-binding protein